MIVGWIAFGVGVAGLIVVYVATILSLRATVKVYSLRRRALSSPIISEEDDGHCDTYITNPNAPKQLRWFLFVHRLPASDRLLCAEFGVKDPPLYADHKGKRVQVVMASRLGDVGITDVMNAGSRYQTRVPVEDLTNFGAVP